MVRISMLTQQGVSRENNEDSIAVRHISGERYIVLCLCDGVGGGDYGEMASKYVALAMTRRIRGDVESVILNRAMNISQKLKCLQGNPKTTALVVVIDVRDGCYYCMNVGDSRMYKVRNASAYQMTRDDVVGILGRSFLSNAVGSGLVQPIITRGDLVVGDTLVLMSDGAYSKLEISDIKDICRDRFEDIATGVARMAVGRGSVDDVSIIVCRVE